MDSVSIRAANVAALEASPLVLRALREADVPDGLESLAASDGTVTASWRGMPIHHPAEPKRDARRWAVEVLDRVQRQGARRVAVIGFGLGHHVEALADQFDGEIVIHEPSLGLLRWALAQREVPELLRRARIVLDPAEDMGTDTCIASYAPLRLLEGEVFARAVRRCQEAAAQAVGKLRVLVVTPLYGGSYPIARHAQRALQRLGHDATLCDLSSFHDGFEQLAQFRARPSRRRMTESLFCEALGDGVAAQVEEQQIDLVLALAQAPLGERALKAIGRAGALSAFWFVEDRRVFPYWKEIAPHYDHVFAIQDGEGLAEMRAAGVSRVDYLPCAAAPDVHRPLALSPHEQREFGSDVSFVGAGYRNRRHAFRRFLDLDFRIWGSDWEGAADLGGNLQRDGLRISSEDSVRIWNASKVNLNLHSSTYCDGVDPRGDFVNPRTFELAAANAFQIVDHRSSLADCFAPGREIVAVDSVDAMKDATLHYLERPEERAQIAELGRARALRDHTYERRMESLLTAVITARPDHFARRDAVYRVGDARAAAPAGLAAHLSQFADDEPFTLETMVGRIPDAEGALTEPEALFLFLTQFDDMYLTEYRQ